MAIMVMLPLMSHIVVAKMRDATLSVIYNQATSKVDIERINKELGKEFGTIQPFDLRKKTNFFINYYIMDENFIQYEVTKKDMEDQLGEFAGSQKSDGFVGSAQYEAYKRRNQLNIQFSSGAREITAKTVEKPFKGTMVLYNSYGTELIRVETEDYFKSESGALRNAIRKIRRAIGDEKEKMTIPQKFRCLFCDYNELKTRQKERVLHLAYIAHENMLNRLYGNITENELPIGLTPYAILYLSLKNIEILEHIIDTNAVVFDNQLGTRKIPGHLINELIKLNAPDQLLAKVANAYKKNEFEELDINNHTPLWSAISQRDIKLMQKLIHLGAGVNQVTQVNTSILSPLILSAQLGNIETSKLLLENGAKKELTTATGQSAWSTAMWLGQYEHADLLWPDSIIDPSSSESKNFLTQAAYFGQIEKIENLQNKGVPVTSRGQTGDNIVMSAIKGLKTFAIRKTDNSLTSTNHQIDKSTYWQIIEDVKNTGFSDPVISSIDSKKQTLLFHAYPDGSDPVTDQHIDLITRLMKLGVDPSVININGQTAEQAYMQARFNYFDEQYKTQLEQINQQSREAARFAQRQQDDSMEVALEEISKQKTNRSRSRASTRARRIEALNKMDDSLSRAGGATQTSSFIRDTSDVEPDLDYNELENDVVSQIRAKYSQALKDVNDVAEHQKQELELYIKTLKAEETKNAKLRQQIVF